MMMKKVWMLLLVAGLLVAANSADAGVFGRHLGLGWGDGYHAKCGCGHGCGGGLFHRFICSDPCWNDPACVKTKVVSPGCFDCHPQMPPTYVPAPGIGH